MLSLIPVSHDNVQCSLTEDLETVGDQAGVARGVGGHTPVLPRVTPEHGAELQPGPVADQ